MRQTVFTPTYNRAGTLPRLWKSIKKQTFKDFVWLIVDDGSTDNTKQVVEGFIAEDQIPVRYVYKPNGGKHTAQWLAYHEVDTPYVTEIDSDDAMLPDTVESFEEAWIQIEKEGKGIAKVSMFTKDNNNNTRGVGSFSIPGHVKFIDATWQEYVLKLHNHREMVSSLSVNRFLECYNIENYPLYRDKINFLGESIIWSCIGRTYPTRILNKYGLCVYLDAANSILRGTHNYYNGIVSSYYFIEENIGYFWWNPKYFLGEIKNYIKSCKGAGLSFKESYKLIKSGLFRVSFILFYPLF